MRAAITSVSMSRGSTLCPSSTSMLASSLTSLFSVSYALPMSAFPFMVLTSTAAFTSSGYRHLVPGKSIAYEFTAKILKLCGIEAEKFSAGSDSKLIGSVIEVPKVDEDGKKVSGVDFEIIPGLLNGYKTPSLR